MAPGSPGRRVADRYVGDPRRFLRALAHQYFKVTTEAIHAQDRNHLILGVKQIAQLMPSEVLKPARPYVDVFSVDDYQPSPNELRADAAELLPLLGRDGREPPRTMAILARQPDFLALRAAWNCRSVFEWAEHVGYARTAGITELEIDAVTQDVSVGGWSVAEAGLLRAADELHRDQDVSDETRGILASAYDTAQLVEILYVVGQYTMLSMVGNAAGIGTPPGLPAMPVVP